MFMITIFFRALFLLIISVVIMRLMGKKEVGQLQPYEFVIAILLADLAAAPISDNDIPLLYGIIPIVLIFLFHYMLVFISLKSEKMRRIICGKPSIVIDKGAIVEKEMAKIGYNLNDLIEQLHTKGFQDVREVHYAILETNGDLSVFPKVGDRPATSNEMGLTIQQYGIPHTLILDGNVKERSLKQSNVDGRWLHNQVARLGFSGVNQIFFCSLSDDGVLFLQGKQPDARVVMEKLKIKGGENRGQ